MSECTRTHLCACPHVVYSMVFRVLCYSETSFTLDELFPGPQMQELVRLLEEPGVIEVLFESANSKEVNFL